VDNIVPLLGAFIGPLSNIHAEEQDVIASQDLVALRLVVTATQTGDLLGIPASGRDVRWDAVDIYRVNDAGKISEQWAFEDLAAVLSQVGGVKLPWAWSWSRLGTGAKSGGIRWHHNMRTRKKSFS
jgi:hypothetical protein